MLIRRHGHIDRIQLWVYSNSIEMGRVDGSLVEEGDVLQVGESYMISRGVLIFMLCNLVRLIW